MPTISYKRLWKLLIDREIKKSELQRLASLSQTTMTKLSKGKNLTTDILVRICSILNCKLEDIAEVIPGDSDNMENNSLKEILNYV